MPRLLRNFSDLREFGINPLTGEACPWSQRLLCDLNERGRRIVLDMLGCDIGPLPHNWNGGAEFSMMLPMAVLDIDVPLWCLISIGYTEFVVSKDGLCGRDAGDTDEEWEQYFDTLQMLSREPRKIWPTGGPRRGSRMVHAISGRAS